MISFTLLGRPTTATPDVDEVRRSRAAFLDRLTQQKDAEKEDKK
jgi:hypothetical protein